MPAAISSGIGILTNISAENAYLSLVRANKDIALRQLRITTGKRINSPADDVAGYITVKSLHARNAALKAALVTTNEAKNVTALTQDAFDNITQLLADIKNSASSAAAGTVGTDEVVALAKSAFQLARQIDLVADTTSFGGKQILEGNFAANWVIGFNARSTALTLSIDLTTGNADIGTSSGIFSVKKNAKADVKIKVKKEKDLSNETAQEAVASNNGNGNGNSNGNGNGNSQAVGNANANANAKDIEDTADKLDTEEKVITMSVFAGVSGLNLDSLNDINENDLGIFSEERIGLTLTSLSIALSNVSKAAAYLGGIQNRLESQDILLQSQILNYNTAISRIEDADVANEQLALIKAQFLQRLSLISLTQANATAEAYLQLFASK